MSKASACVGLLPRRGLVCASLVLLACIIGASAVAQEAGGLKVQGVKRHVLAPPFELPTLDGERVSLADQRGSLVLVHFWATWCRSCREELPSLLAAQDWAKGLSVLAIAVDRGDPAHIRRYLASLPLGPTLTVLHDRDGQVRETYAVQALPVTYVVGQDGRLLARAVGARDWQSEAAKRYLRGLGAEP